MSSTTEKSQRCDKSHKFVNSSHFSWKIVTTIALMAAVISPAQAQTKGFSNVRINGVPLEVARPDGTTFMPLDSIKGSGPDGRTFVFTADLYNANGVTPDPIDLPDALVFTFQASSNSTLPKPNDFVRFYQGDATLGNPASVSYTNKYDLDGTFEGSLFAQLVREKTDYDLPVSTNSLGNGDGKFDTPGRGFMFTLVAEKPVSIPEATPTLGLIMLGAGCVASQIKKIKLVRKQIN